MKLQSYRWIWLLATIALLPPLVLDGAQAPTGGLRIVTPPDGTTVEPGQRFAVAIEGQRGVTPAAVSINSPGIFAVREHPPFTFSVSYPANAPLGPKRLIADGMDAQERSLGAQITINVETSTPLKSIQVRFRTVGRPAMVNLIAGITEERLRVEGAFVDGTTRDISKSREIQYVSANPLVAAVAPDGLVQAIDNGATAITITYKSKSITVPVKVEFKKVSVPIDIRPESSRNVVNLDSKGRFPVTIFSTPTFNATRVRLDTVRFGPGGAKPVAGDGDRKDEDPGEGEREDGRGKIEHVEDINGDRLPDLLLFFRIQEIGLTCADTQATLTGFTLLGEKISGSDKVQPVGPGCR